MADASSSPGHSDENTPFTLVCTFQAKDDAAVLELKKQIESILAEAPGIESTSLDILADTRSDEHSTFEQKVSGPSEFRFYNRRLTRGPR